MDFFKNIILKKDVLGNASLIEQPGSLHIAFGIDANFTLGTGVLIYSILNKNNNNFIFHIFTDSIYEKDTRRFNKLCSLYPNICIIIYHVNPVNFSSLPTEYTWSQAIYYRILACEFLNEVTAAVLYIDSDTLCTGNIENLFQKNFKSNIAMAYGNIEKKDRYIKSLDLNFKNSMYLNSGVMYINLPNWKSNNISYEFLDLLTHHNDFKYFDQDVLNILLKDKFILLDESYNLIRPLMDSYAHIPENTIFIHYAGSTKPWQSWGQYHPLTKMWLKYKNKSPWKEEPISQPQTYKQAKFMARALKHNKKYFASLYWYYKYSVWKLANK